MNLLVDYVQPLTNWLQAHPNWALLITFIIALSESLAIVGSIVPGSVTMTAIGILAGTGIMSIDLTLLSATLGAICGDSLSYFLGYYYSDSLIEIWPFKKYPGLIKYGKDFFTHHGGKSVLIGRFVGPLRSIIPVIAGIMHMPQWRFLLANTISGIGWAVLYVVPGVIIGAAGHELSAEVATRLFILILVILASIWLISFVFKLIFRGLQRYFKSNLHHLWIALHKKPYFSGLLDLITPSYEENHYSTIGLLIITLVTLTTLVILSLLAFNGVMYTYIDLPLHYFIQSVNNSIFKAFFIGCSQLTSTLSIITLSIIFCFWFLYHKNIKAMIYLISILIATLFIAYGLNILIHYPRPEGLLFSIQSSSFPSINLSLITVLYSFILFYITSHYTLITGTLKTIILIILGLAGFAEIYLGDSWISSIVASYLLGTSLCLIYYLSYRKSVSNHVKSNHALGMIATLILGTLFACFISTYTNYKLLIHNHMPYLKEHIISEHQWWEQKQPILPLYRLSRVGKRISLLNIQFVGDLHHFQSNLEKYGWQSHNDRSFWSKLVLRMSNNEETVKLPLLSPLYENKKPELVMTFKDKKLKLILELTIWESNFYLSDKKYTVWIGSVHQNLLNIKNKSISSPLITDLNPISYVTTALDNKYNLKRIIISSKYSKSTMFPTLPYLLLIKEN
jgi:membrane protein DedA with SNARE-associated domain